MDNCLHEVSSLYQINCRKCNKPVAEIVDTMLKKQVHQCSCHHWNDIYGTVYGCQRPCGNSRCNSMKV